MKILSFGSLNLDNVYSVDHFVTPGETMSSHNLEKFCGGKGLNQSIALAKAGADVYHAGKVGKSDGGMLLNILVESGVDISNIGLSDGPSGHAIIQINKKGQNCIILFGGSNQEIDFTFIDNVLAKFDAGDIILLQNEINNLDYIMNKSHEFGLKIALNPSPMDDKLLTCPLEKVDLFILNEVEGYQISGKNDPSEIIDSIHKKYKGAKICLTLGKHGVVYFDGKKHYSHGIYDVPVVDTTAAGDTFTGYLLACLGDGLSADISLEKASKASSLAVSIKGASNSIPTMAMVDATDIKLDPRSVK